MRIFVFTLLILFAFHACIGRDIHIVPIVGGLNGTATTTRYWDCCKPSCSWEGNVDVVSTAWSCLNDGVSKLEDDNVQSGCDPDKDGAAFMCSDQVGIIVNDTLAYGFAAVSFSGGVDLSRCCQCMLLTFQDYLIQDQQMIVQITSTGSDLPANHFDIAIPGGGNGLKDMGCTYQWGNGTFDSIESADDCLEIDESLQPGCLFRFTWMKGSANPPVTFQEVECPQEIIDASGFHACFGRDIHIVPIVGGFNGTATTTRYWDCCKPSCSWEGNAHLVPTVWSCLNDGVTKLEDDNVQSGCDPDKDGYAFMCSDQVGIIVNDTFAYGFAAASFSGGVDESRCCQCMLLTFQASSDGKDYLIQDQQMIVQVTSTGSDLPANHFDIAIPGGGNGLKAMGCTYQWGNGTFDSIESADDCLEIDESLQPGCLFRFTWMKGSANPPVTFQEVECPQEIIDVSGCRSNATEYY
ncbi:hypothetical protein NQ317_018566 [Molorchus minor]|uniref:Cellulase n=1 Tax=Molorchus minor TaxID=1323400 RepID=A0ABQ9JW31_9CUCU|nr:hypothetical protein NQ317_018566 [Molorchus minor]